MLFIGNERRKSGWNGSTVYRIATENYGATYGSFTPYNVSKALPCPEGELAPELNHIMNYRIKSHDDDYSTVSVYDDMQGKPNVKHSNTNYKNIKPYDTESIVRLFNQASNSNGKLLCISDGIMLYEILTMDDNKLIDVSSKNVILAGTTRYYINDKAIVPIAQWYSSDTMSRLFIYMCRIKGYEKVTNNRLYKELLEDRHLLIRNPALLMALASCSNSKATAKSILDYVWRHSDLNSIDGYLNDMVTECIANGVLNESDVDEIIYNSKSIVNHKKLSRINEKKSYRYEGFTSRYKLNIENYKNYILTHTVYLGLDKFINDLTDNDLKRIDIAALDKAFSNNYFGSYSGKGFIDAVNKAKSNTSEQQQLNKRLTAISKGMNKSANCEGYKALFTFIDMADKQDIESEKERIAGLVIEWVVRSNNFSSWASIMYTNLENHEIIAREMFRQLNTQNIRSIRSFLNKVEHNRDTKENSCEFRNTCYFNIEFCDPSNKKIYKAYTEMTLS